MVRERHRRKSAALKGFGGSSESDDFASTPGAFFTCEIIKQDLVMTCELCELEPNLHDTLCYILHGGRKAIASRFLERG